MDDTKQGGPTSDLLTAEQREQIDRALAVIATDEHAPTTIRDPERAFHAHVMDSLVALELAAVRSGRRIVDMGSGAGFPGVALAVALPEAEVVLVDSQRRKCEFLARLCTAAGVANARVVCARVEEWTAGRCYADVVLARALAPQQVVLEYAAPLLALEGVLVDWRGRREPDAEAAGLRAAAELGLRREQVRAVHPFAGATDRHVHVFVKAQQTPARFPRRAGMARKRPLAG